MTGPALLRRYLRETKQKPADLSRATGIDEGAISRWLRGERRPGLDNADLLEQHTGVPAKAWASSRRKQAA